MVKGQQLENVVSVGHLDLIGAGKDKCHPGKLQDLMTFSARTQFFLYSWLRCSKYSQFCIIPGKSEKICTVLVLVLHRILRLGNYAFDDDMRTLICNINIIVPESVSLKQIDFNMTYLGRVCDEPTLMWPYFILICF